MLKGLSGEALRLPQDVVEGDRRGVPDLRRLRRSSAVYARRRDAAVKGNDYAARVRACWGLVARGSESLHWCVEGLQSGDADLAADAAGVLRWIGVPESWKPRLKALLDCLPDGEAADALLEALPEITAADGESAPGPAEPGQLFGGALLPFTEPIWYVELPLDEAVAQLELWRQRKGRQETHLELHEPLELMLQRLEPWAMPSWRYLLVQTAGDWTAVFTQGSDIYVAEVIAEARGVRSLTSRYFRHVVRDKKVAQYGDRTFWLHRGHAPLRSIQATQQGRWEWHTDGEPLPFETTDAYDANRIPDRLTLDRLNQYCRSIGIKRDDPAFYLPRGLLVTEESWDTSKARWMSRQEWQEDHLRS